MIVLKGEVIHKCMQIKIKIKHWISHLTIKWKIYIKNNNLVKALLTLLKILVFLPSYAHKEHKKI
jgi:hypothetical protein